MTIAHTVRVGELDIGNDLPLTVIAGPCAMESRAHALENGWDACARQLLDSLVTVTGS